MENPCFLASFPLFITKRDTMDYRWHYNALMERAASREIEKGIYSEKHHVIPVSEGGSNDSSNIVRLYPREHFIAHWLLYREDPNSISRGFAFNMMSCDRLGTYKPSSRAYAEGVEAAAKANKANFTGRKAIHDPLTLKAKFVWEHQLEYWLEKGWLKGPSPKAFAAAGKKWYNNGTEELYFEEGTAPQGWVKGRLGGTTTGREAISKDGVVKFVADPTPWLEKGWSLGNAKYYPGWKHCQHVIKSKAEGH